MSETPAAPGETHSQRLFWGCFIALITTGFAFISRMFLIGVWGEEFGLDGAQQGALLGIGVWPFALSIILFSLVIDRIGYKTAMVFSFGGYLIWSVMGVAAYFVSDGGKGDTDTAYQLLYWGSLILALSNGTVEAYINPVVATIFNKEKTKWLNILHAGWPGGLVLAGLLTIAIDGVPWWIRIAIIAPPAVVFFVMLIGETFPEQERVASGVTYREMLAEFGILTAIVVGFLMSLQLMDFFKPETAGMKGLCIAAGVAFVIAVGVYTRALGNLLLFVLALIMVPLATTEIGTDGWITGIMEGIAKESNFHPGLVLVYTSLIMMVLRFFAGSIVHKISPLGLLAVSAVLAIAGLYTLSFTTGMMIFAAATLYAVGKTFFWPTMLGIASEQTPKGGALTLNALGGIGMLAVGTLGFPFIGALQEGEKIEAVEASAEVVSEMPALIDDGSLVAKDARNIYEVIDYEGIDVAKVDRLLADQAVPAAVVDQVVASFGFEDPKEDEEGLSARDQALGLLATVIAAEDDEAEGTDEYAEALTAAAAAAEVELSDAAADAIVAASAAADEAIAPRRDLLGGIEAKATQGALATMAVFPAIMLVAFIALILYFKSKGGYAAKVLATPDSDVAAEPAAHASEA